MKGPLPSVPRYRCKSVFSIGIFFKSKLNASVPSWSSFSEYDFFQKCIKQTSFYSRPGWKFLKANQKQHWKKTLAIRTRQKKLMNQWMNEWFFLLKNSPFKDYFSFEKNWIGGTKFLTRLQNLTPGRCRRDFSLLLHLHFSSVCSWCCCCCCCCRRCSCYCCCRQRTAIKF